MKFSRDLLSILIAIFHIISVALLSFKSSNAIFINTYLDEQSFSLQSSVGIVIKKEYKFGIHVEEMYSFEQKRARIEVITRFKDANGTSTYGPSLGTYFVDKSPNQKGKSSVLFLLDKTDCQKSTVVSLVANTLFFQIAGVMEEDNSPNAFAPSHIVGPARLIFFVAKHADELKLDDTEDNQQNKTIRNIPYKLYTFEYVKNNERIKFRVYMGDIASTSAISYHEWPLRIIVEKGDDFRNLISVDYSKLEYLSDASSSGGTSENEIELDTFTTLPLTGCYNALREIDPAKEVDLFSKRSELLDKFSFEAIVEGTLGARREPIRMETSVAFDGRLESMSLDLTAIKSEAPSGLSARIKKHLYNFQANRMYHVLQRNKVNDASLAGRVYDLSRELDRDSGAKTDTTQCVIAEVVPEEIRLEKGKVVSRGLYSIGELLVGAEKFVYLGKAKVRGINARVYEALSGPERPVSLPFWVDPPIYYQTSMSSKWELRKRYAELEGNLYNTILYVADSDDEEWDNLLMMDIFTITPNFLSIKSRQRIKFFNFAWELNGNSASGQSIEDFFSLKEHCSSNKDEYARVEMLLEAEEMINSKEALQQLEKASFRNMALQASIQENFRLPASMIFDFQSRFLERQFEENQLTKRKGDLVSLSFHVAEHHQKLVRMLYMGVGELNLRYKGERLEGIVRSLQACFFLAGHIRGARIFFGYNEKRKVCSIDLEPARDTRFIIDEKLKKNIPAFLMPLDNSKLNIDDQRRMEIYLTIPESDYSIPVATNMWIADVRNLKNKIRMLNARLVLRDLIVEENTSSNGSISFRVKDVHLIERNSKNNLIYSKQPQNQNLDSVIISDDRITGLGLDENDHKFNRIIEGPNLNSIRWKPDASGNSQSAMNQDQCRAACLLDLECKSFSLCYKRAEIQCVLSKLSFREQRIQEEIAEKLSDPSATSSTIRKIKVELNPDESVNLEKNRNCELFNKNYMDFYEKPMLINQIFSNRQIIPVENTESCAKLCTELNIEAMEREFKLTFEPKYYSSYSAKHYNQTKQVCRAFLYIDKVSLTDHLEKQFMDNILPEDMKLVKEKEIIGYCILGPSPSNREKEIMKPLIESRVKAQSRPNFESDIKLLTNLNIYYFRYEYFYQKQFGVKLRASKMNPNQMKAYSAIRKLNLISSLEKSDNFVDDPMYQSSIETMEDFVESGNNIQIEVSADETYCARFCFLQTLRSWPVCKSFDIVITINSQIDAYLLKCYLNSITIKEALEKNKFDLIFEGKGDGMDSENNNEDDLSEQRWHFEPRLGVAENEVKLEEQRSFDNLNYILAQLRRQHHFRFHAFGISLLLLIGISIGGLLAFKYGNTINARMGLTEDHLTERSILVSEIDFENQVNSDGIILEKEQA